MTSNTNYLRQSVEAERKTLEFNTATFKKLAELRERYGVALNNQIHGEFILEFPEGTTPDVIEQSMKELYAVTME